jgi:iron complex outermembrane receptor protein
MRFLTGCLLIAFLLGAYTYSYAQTDSGIHGKVTDEKHIAAEAATVILLAATDSSIIRSTPCDANGVFKFTAKPGNYLLLITKIGFDQSLNGPYTVTPGNDVGVKDISLEPHIPQLKEVSITAQRSYTEVKPGKIILNVQGSVIADGSSAAEILKQAPGVHLDGKGGLSIIGRQHALVIIDGQQVNVSGQDLTDLLQSLPGNNIQTIELITNPSAKYEASGGGIVNIKLRKGTSTGTNVTVNGMGGYGTYYKARGGLIFNNRMDNINIFGNYTYEEDKNFHNFITDRNIDYNGILSKYYADYNSIRLRKTHTFKIGTDIALTPNHIIGMFISGTVDKFGYTKNNKLYITNQGHLDSIISTTANTNQDKSNISYDINYSGKLDKKGVHTLSADIAYNNIDRHTFEYIDNYFNTASGAIYRPTLYLQNLSPSNINIWAAKLDYCYMPSANSQWDIGIKYSSVKSNNDLIFGPKVNGVYTSSPAFSNTFIYTENVNAGYVNYTGKIGKINVIAGLRAEQTVSNGNLFTQPPVKKNYIDWFPQVTLNYTINDKNELNFSYNRGINRAPYEYINPFRRYVDLYDYTEGNAGLLPQYTDKIEIAHVYNKIWVTSIYGMTTSNFYNMNNLLQDEATKVSITTNSNFGTYSVLGLKVNTSDLVFTPWWTASFGVDASYQRIKAYLLYGNLNKGTSDVIVTSAQTFKLNNTTFQLSGKYETPTFYGIGKFKSVYQIDAGISQQLLDKKATLKLIINDIFNSQRDYDMIKYGRLNATIYNKDETRWFKLSFTYRFGNISLKGNAKHKAGNEDEQLRAGGVAGSTQPN